MKNRNLQRKKNLTQQSTKRQASQPPKVKRVWVRKDDPKCLVIHTTLRAESSSRWYLDIVGALGTCPVRESYSPS